MASYVPCKKNDANGYITYISLISQADGTIFQVNPTLAAGDVKIAIDDGAPANLGTLPAVDADFTKRVKVVLSQAETNGDNLTIIFSDAAGDEWCDLIINIQTSAQTLDEIDTVVDAIPTTAMRGTDNVVLAGPTKAQMDTAHALLATPAQVATALTNYDAATGTEIAALNDISVANIIAGIADGSYDLQKMIRIIFAACAGKSSGGGSTEIKFRNSADDTDRITATVDASGNRSAITLDGS